MKEFPIPVVPFGPGSHPDAEAAEYLPLPHDMQTFVMPASPLEADPRTLAAACALIEDLRDAMRHTTPNGPGRPRISLTGVLPEVIELLNQSLGHGEVSILVRAPVPVRIQETVFAGVWRVQELDAQGALQRDALVAGAIPYVAEQSALMGARAPAECAPAGAGIMNAPAVYHELVDRSRRHASGRPAHVVNLTLLPMTPEDLAFLGDALGIGPVSILSRGYGNCRITSTRLAHVWWVQYFNSMDQLILNTLEVVDVPEVALASPEDYQDSIDRLGEWLDVMREPA